MTERYQVILGDNVEYLKTMPDQSVDSIVTDPPYGLEFMGKEWDAPWKAASDAPKTASHGFQVWCQTWASECFRVLKPGGYIAAFGGTRMYHRLASGIEDAGFEIRDTLMYLYGSGFPKSMSISKAIDKSKGLQGGQGPMKLGGERLLAQTVDGKRDNQGQWNDESGRDPYTYLPASPEAKQWDGWGTALKPAYEPIILARKPFNTTLVSNVLTYGTGAINIDACRIPSDGDHIQKREVIVRKSTLPGDPRQGASLGMFADGKAFTVNQSPLGRWPANVLLDEAAAETLDEDVGELQKSKGNYARKHGAKQFLDQMGSEDRTDSPNGIVDSGGPSRFFYTAKTSRSERQTSDETVYNNHITVKPVSLMRWLVKLVTPPGGLVLDPFNGSGSTGVAALKEGFNYIGLEKEPNYVKISEVRLKDALKTDAEPENGNPKKAKKTAAKKTEEHPLESFELDDFLR